MRNRKSVHIDPREGGHSRHDRLPAGQWIRNWQSPPPREWAAYTEHGLGLYPAYLDRSALCGDHFTDRRTLAFWAYRATSLVSVEVWR